MNENTTVSLQLLLLKDLFNANAIDKTVYEKASKRIRSTVKLTQTSENTVLQASA